MYLELNIPLQDFHKKQLQSNFCGLQLFSIANVWDGLFSLGYSCADSQRYGTTVSLVR